MRLQDANDKVKIQTQLTEAFDIASSVRQDDALSTILFNMVPKKMKRNTETNPYGTIFNRTRQYIAHADDVLICGMIGESN
jgi:hypothetical protein